jgi:hypothetical protein
MVAVVLRPGHRGLGIPWMVQLQDGALTLLLRTKAIQVLRSCGTPAREMETGTAPPELHSVTAPKLQRSNALLSAKLVTNRSYF